MLNDPNVDIFNANFLNELILRMTALGQKRTLRRAGTMSALPLKADIRRCRWNVRFGSKADITACPLDVRFTPESGHDMAISSRRTSTSAIEQKMSAIG